MRERPGGVIIDIVEVDPTRWWVDTWDNSSDMRTSAVYCDPGCERPTVGDSLWWDDDNCFWTPADGSRSGVLLAKIGEAGAPHPNIPPAEQSARRVNGRRGL